MVTMAGAVVGLVVGLVIGKIVDRWVWWGGVEFEVPLNVAF
jgi:Na+/glutamate symporter